MKNLFIYDLPGSSNYESNFYLETLYIVKRNVLENHKKVLEKSWNFLVQHLWEACVMQSEQKN